MKLNCPQCDLVIPNAIRPNAAKNLFCPHCEKSFDKEAFREMNDADFDPADMPKGVSLEVTDQSWQLVVSLRSWISGVIGFCFTTAFASAMFWTLIKTPDLTLAWMGFAFFGVAVSCGCYWQASLRLWGVFVITIEGDQATVFTGVGNTGDRQQFDWSQVSRIENKLCQVGDSRFYAIVLHCPTEIEIGKLLSERQRYYVLRVLRRWGRDGKCLAQLHSSPSNDTSRSAHDSK